jgi:hypothetical protein
MINAVMVGSMMLAGVVAVAAAIFEWDGFMATPQVKVAVRVFGREGARLAYIMLGVMCIVFALMAGRV